MQKKLLLVFGILGFLVLAYVIADALLFDGIKPQLILENGIHAKFYAKEGIKSKTTIVLVGGGTWGDYWSQQFSKKSLVGFSLPYIDVEGMPKLPEELPLEYFERAFEWLIQRPEVNTEKIVVMGASRNAELALVLAATFPNYISGAIAYAPSAVSWSNTVLPYSSDTIKPSWTYNNEKIPYVPMEKIKGNKTDTIALLDYWKVGLRKSDLVEKALIKVERIKGNVLLFSGKEDRVWPSSQMADMIEKRAANLGFVYSLQNIQYDNAGHLISSNPAQEVNPRNGVLYIDGKAFSCPFGGSNAGDFKAKRDAKQKVHAFLENIE